MRVICVCIIAAVFFTKFLFSDNQKPYCKIISDIFYAGTENPRQTLDLYLPNKTKLISGNSNPLPVIIWIHGGGWKNGSKESARLAFRLPEILSTARYAGVSINYRLSGEEKWPAQIHDCKAAVRWIRANAEKYNFDKGRIAAWGSSAGGHLVSMLASTNGVEQFEGRIGKNEEFSSEVHAVVNFFGPSNFLKMDNFPSKIFHRGPNSPESQLLGQALDKVPELAKMASPYHHINKNLPPFIHFHGTDDPLVPYNQSLILHQKLLSKGNKSTLITVQNGLHSMPTHFTRRWVIPFLDYHFYGIGSPPVTQTVIVDRKKI